MKIQIGLKEIVLLSLGFFIIAIALISCGKAYSSAGAYASTIMSNMPGYTCFIIRDENGTAVGGNCVRD